MDIQKEILIKFIFPKLNYKSMIRLQLVFRNITKNDINHSLSLRKYRVYDVMINTIINKLTNKFGIFFDYLYPQLFLSINLKFTVFRDLTGENKWPWQSFDNTLHINKQTLEATKDNLIKIMKHKMNKYFLEEIERITPLNTLKDTVVSLQNHIRRSYSVHMSCSFYSLDREFYRSEYIINNGLHSVDFNWENNHNIQWKKEYMRPIQQEMKQTALMFEKCILNAPFNIHKL